MRPPILFLTLLAILLGVGTCTGVLVLRVDHLLASRSEPSAASRVLMPRERGWDFWSSQIDTVTSELRKERANLEKRSAELDALALRLAAETAELSRARAEVEAIRAEITTRIPVLEIDEKANLKSLSRSYSAMRPREAVAILGAMDDEVSVKILALMKPDVVGAILQQMAAAEPEAENHVQRAARLSNQLRLLRQEDPDVQ